MPAIMVICNNTIIICFFLIQTTRMYFLILATGQTSIPQCVLTGYASHRYPSSALSSPQGDTHELN